MLKIAVVNDSVMAAESLRRVVERAPAYQLAWVACNGAEAVQKCADLCPDIILMDLIMPEMDGIEATRAICAQYQCAILVVTASVDGHAGKVFEAMGAGALDAVNTPILGSGGNGAGEDILLGKIKAIATLLNGKPHPRGSDRPGHAGSPAGSGPPLIAVGASTGGPSALREVLGALPPEPGVAIAVVQHVDEQFAASFTHWLNDQVPLCVRAARAGEPPTLNTALVCTREDHLVLGPDGRFDYSPEPRSLVYRPSVDVFFQSLADNYKNQIIGVLLTGMGKDGAVGLKALRDHNWCTLAQDEASSAVYGMPKAAKELGAACEILSLVNIGPRLAEWAEQAASRDANHEEANEQGS
jgi:two-component system response regulator WspF